MRKIDIDKTLLLLDEYKKGNLIIQTSCCNKRANLFRCMNELVIECPDCGDYVANICFVEPKENDDENAD